MYKFLKEPLIRKFGQAWYDELEIAAEELKKEYSFNQENALDIVLKETGKVFASAELIETIALVLEVSVSALFYSPEEKSLDDSDISKIEKILDEESAKAVQNIKNRLHEGSIHS